MGGFEDLEVGIQPFCLVTIKNIFEARDLEREWGRGVFKARQLTLIRKETVLICILFFSTVQILKILAQNK